MSGKFQEAWIVKKAGGIILKFALVLVAVGLLSGAYWWVATLFKGEVFVEMRTGNEETFQLDEAQPLMFFDTNTGFGSSPGHVNPTKGVFLYDPDGELVDLDRKGTSDRDHYFGDFVTTKPGEYRFVLEELEKVQSKGALVAYDSIPGRGVSGWTAIICLFWAAPTAFLGGCFWIFSGKEEATKNELG
ncbi:MAG: hypothetical protein ACON38_10475 [Akkermansiaceae bacterium]